jgi:hypothetical protein
MKQSAIQFLAFDVHPATTMACLRETSGNVVMRSTVPRFNVSCTVELGDGFSACVAPRVALLSSHERMRDSRLAPRCSAIAVPGVASPSRALSQAALDPAASRPAGSVRDLPLLQGSEDTERRFWPM